MKIILNKLKNKTSYIFGWNDLTENVKNDMKRLILFWFFGFIHGILIVSLFLH